MVWIGYTLAPMEGISPEELCKELDDPPEEVLEASGHEDGSRVTPLINEEFDVVGRAITSTDGVRQALLNWFSDHHDIIRICYLARMNDTTDTGTIRVYIPKGGGMVKGREVHGHYATDNEKTNRDESFPERAAQLHPEDFRPQSVYDERRDFISSLQEELGARPLVFYE